MFSPLALPGSRSDNVDLMSYTPATTRAVRTTVQGPRRLPGDSCGVRARHVPMYKLRPTFKMSGSSAKRQMMERQLRLNEAVTQDSAERLRDRQKISREGMAPPRPSTASPYFMKGNKTRVFPRAAPGKALSSTVHIASPATVSWPKARLISHSQIGRSSDRQTLKLKIN